MLDLFSKLREVIAGRNVGVKIDIPASQRMIILGNAPLKRNMSEYIDSSAAVVRFNECKNIGRKVGSKTDYLCINNLGSPTNRFINRQLIKKLPFIGEVKEIWFPRNSEIMIAHRRELEPSLNEDEFQDKSNEIVLSNSLSGKTIINFTKEQNLSVISGITGCSLEEFLEPSTGILAIEYVLSEPRFDKYIKVLLGFNFKGWSGHPWGAEEALLMRRAAQREDFFLEP